MSLSANSQNVTKTQLTDSVVILPKKLAIFMLQDLYRADQERVELQLQIEQNKLQEEYIKASEEVQITLQNRINLSKEIYTLCSDNADSLQVLNLQANKKIHKLEKQNKILKTIGTIITSILIIKLL